MPLFIIGSTNDQGGLAIPELDPELSEAFSHLLKSKGDDAFMTASRFRDCANEFDDRFKYQADRERRLYSGIADEYQCLRWNDLLAKANEAGDAKRMLLVFFGLEQKELRYGLHFLTYDDSSTPWTFTAPATPKYLLRAGLFHELAEGEWAPMESAYWSHVSVLRTADPSDRFISVEAAYDSRYVSIPFDEEIALMHRYTHVDAPIGYRVAIDSVSVYSSGWVDGPVVKEPQGFYHGVAFYLEKFREEGDPLPMLDEGNLVSIYKNKAADLGNRCPPRCNEYLKEW